MSNAWKSLLSCGMRLDVCCCRHKFESLCLLRGSAVSQFLLFNVCKPLLYSRLVCVGAATHTVKGSQGDPRNGS
jgi:hypothetical protein